jgi:hypothetical protein
MKKSKDILCEIIFEDNRLGLLTSRIGKIDPQQLKALATNSDGFVIFKEKYNPPILKTDINQIIIHRDDRKMSIIKSNSGILKHIKSKDKGKII